QASLAPAVVAALRAGLTDPDAWVRYYSCQSLGRLGALESAEAIVALMHDPAGQVRVAAVESIARIGGEHAITALDVASRSDDPDVHRAAVLGIGSTRRADALPVLLRELASTDSATRLVTLSALAELGAPEAFTALLGALSDEEASVRSAAFAIVEAHRSPRLTPWLIDQLSVDALRPWAIRVLGTPREGRVEQLLSALEIADSTLAPHLVSALTRMNRAHGRAAVVALLGSENVFARRAAASALAGMSTDEARLALAHAAETDADAEVREMCLVALPRRVP
ncbi:MAG: HEAT repeat domain-containing protein, partial [Polyangiaceae bacterium]